MHNIYVGIFLSPPQKKPPSFGNKVTTRCSQDYISKHADAIRNHIQISFALQGGWCLSAEKYLCIYFVVEATKSLARIPKCLTSGEAAPKHCHSD